MKAGHRAGLGVGVLVLALVLALLLAGRTHRDSSALPEGALADLIVVEKSRRRMTVWSGGKVLRVHAIALGRSPVGPKEREGDNRTPEGDYRIDGRLRKSGYHRALHVSYPDARDLARARAGGYAPGGAIMIHGMRNGLGWIGGLHAAADWTRGCIAVTDPEIEELWDRVPDGTRIRILP